MHTYYQLQKFRLLTLLSGGIQLMRMFSGVLQQGASNDREVTDYAILVISCAILYD